MRHYPADTVTEVDEAVAAARREGLTDIRVELAWPHYRDLLELKNLDFSAVAVKSWGSAYEKRPLKAYRGHPLKFSSHHSQVLGTDDDSHIIARLVRFNGD